MKALATTDLQHILAHTGEVWAALRGARLFITGGTGFFGRWLLESLTWANDQLDLGLAALVLTRDPAAFAARLPHLAAHPALRFQAGDVRSFALPPAAPAFTHIINAATDALPAVNNDTPLVMLDTIVEGTRRTLDLARRDGASYLLVSSGAVYGPQPPALSHLAEDFGGAPDPTDPGAAYGQGKRQAEFLTATYARQYGLAARIARPFAFVGPALPLDAHFAVGNFIRDGLAGRPLEINGDGTPYRSYLYAADLAIWLWTIMLQGEPGRPYNVGSEEALSIAELAQTVAALFSDPAPVQVARQAQPGVPASRYVPSTRRAEEELGLRRLIDLPEALRRTIEWYS